MVANGKMFGVSDKVCVYSIEDKQTPHTPVSHKFCTGITYNVNYR